MVVGAAAVALVVAAVVAKVVKLFFAFRRCCSLFIGFIDVVWCCLVPVLLSAVCRC